MTYRNQIIKLCAFVMLSASTLGTHANSVGFSSSTYTPENGQLTVTVVYDFTEFAMSSGFFDLVYDSTSLELVSVTTAPLADDVNFLSQGTLVEPGRLALLGISSSKINFFGINSASEYGTFVFNVISETVTDPGCGGFQLCLDRGEFADLFGQDVTDGILDGAQANPVVVPLPASLLFLFSGLLSILGLRKRS